MSYSTTSDFSIIPVSYEQRLELRLAEIDQILNYLIYKEQVNQLWKFSVESTFQSIWSKVGYQDACVSTSCQTDEPLEEDCHTLLELPIHFNETNRALLDEESELYDEELHAVVEVIPSSSPSAHEKEISASFASPEQSINCGNSAMHIRFCSDRQKENVHLNETSQTIQEQGNSFASSAKVENEFSVEEEHCGFEVILSSSSSFHAYEMSASDASPKQPPKRAKKSRSKPVKSYQCSRCECKFSLKVEMAQHERTHGKPSTKCDKCLQVFANRTGFTHHLPHCKYRPNEKGSFECPECGKLCSTRVKLKDHLRHAHHTEKKHKCPVCGRAFNCRSNVKTHMVVHTGATPFRCNICSKRYSASSSLYYHIRKNHGKQQENA